MDGTKDERTDEEREGVKKEKYYGLLVAQFESMPNPEYNLGFLGMYDASIMDYPYIEGLESRALAGNSIGGRIP